MTSVTYEPVRRCRSQASLVVTTPSPVTFRRSQVIFGAAKYGSSGSPVVRVSSSATPAMSVQIAAARRSCQEMAVLRGRPVVRSQAKTVSP